MTTRLLLFFCLFFAAPGQAQPPALPPGHPPLDSLPAPALSHIGTVEELIPAKPYIYVRVQEAGDSQWLAAPEAVLSVGGKVRWADGMPMTNFFSKTLNRTFEKVLFVMQVEAVK